MNYLFPLGFYLMMGAIMPSINPPFRETLIPAMVVLIKAGIHVPVIPFKEVAGSVGGVEF